MVVVAVLDVVTGPEVSFSIFYLAPVVLASWYLGWGAGLLAVVGSTAAWLVADWLAGAVYAVPVTRFWNAGVRAGFFLVVNYILSVLRSALEKERALARTDPLTGLPNARSFLELAGREAVRARRYHHPLTMAYLDVDDFKVVNDRHGHAAGDALLQQVAAVARGAIRELDMAARLGGDEFAVLLPQADAEGAGVVMERMARDLRALVGRAGWPVSFSIGVAVFLTPPRDVADMVRAADRLMYQVKQAGKGAVRYEVLPAASVSAPAGAQTGDVA